MLRNLINETDYSVIKKTNKVYLIFQIIVCVFFLIICVKLFAVISEPRDLTKEEKDKLVVPILFDRNNNILAQTVTSHKIMVTNFDKISLPNKNKLINDVSKISLEKSKEINSITKNSFYIDRSPQENNILETIYLGNPDIKLKIFPKRIYPYVHFTKNLIGKKDIDNKGISLIEKYIDNYKNNLQLSIDINLQKKVSNIFKKELIRYEANYGFFIFIDLEKEEIIINSYDYNNLKSKQSFDDSLMPAIDLTYEFGSVFKPITVFSALKNEVLDLNDLFDVHKPLKFYSGNKIIKDLIKNTKPLSTKDILKESSNIGAVLINRKLDCKNQFKKTINQLGLLEPTLIMKEIQSIDTVKPKYFTNKGNYCDTMAYGYSIAVTPIHLINAYARMITGKINFQATILRNDKPKELKLNKYSSEINNLLFYANQSNHILYKNCLIAGKTGTANDLSSNKSLENNNNVSYISYFPYHKPKYLALTFMNNPRKSDGRFLTAGNTVKNSYYRILDKILFSLEISSCERKLNTI